MRFLPFDSNCAAVVAGWPVTAEEALMWCGLREFPVPEGTVSAWQREPDVTAYALVENELPLAYGELWLDAEEDEVELARIIVAPGVRGRGLGRLLVRGLLAEARLTGLAEVCMRVHPENTAALRCYRGAGFEPVDAASTAAWNTGQPVEYTWLRHGSA
ncbi:GNAT family N-acetyltransferase [Streptomyces sp. SD11]|uniref:GNAT family N-acetyltransferase n=1 Tax=unclassified Streptomyces TaxID=2593676 RepID=UPI00200DA946|nr:GNAT family N-acetyltransferase [Streptomyces sp. LRE541]UPZ27272.1 GNAT family N-acetyltransferase [Streptomyces sp. LRE541]